jgi:putative ABC transport system permease protein
MFRLFKENTKIAFVSIRSQLLRTILTVLIIMIGITALVGILTVVAALKNTITTNFASMGSNTFTINQYEFKTRQENNREKRKINPIISYTQALEFKRKYQFPFTNCSISFTATRTGQVKYETKKTDPEITVMGIDNYYLENSGLQTQLGSNFNEFDIINNNYVCIVGSDFLKGILDGVQPIGKFLSIRGTKFKVIGVLKEKGSTFGKSEDLRIFIPLQLARSLFTAPDVNYTISLLASKNELLNQAVDEALIMMRKVRKLNPIQEANFGIIRSDDLINKIFSITDYLDIAAILISIITIFGSSIALMNIMIVSVTERTREIGVRKALGAKKNTIAFQFFIETLIIGQIGGLLGVILGLLLGYGIATAIQFEFVIPWSAIVLAFIVSFIVAVISGSYPAVKASKLDPIEALRYE